MAEQRKAFKDWFDKDAARAMSLQIAAVYGGFDKRKFCQLALSDIEGMEFNRRIQNFAEALFETLPADFPAAAGILKDSLPEPLGCSGRLGSLSPRTELSTLKHQCLP